MYIICHIFYIKFLKIQKFTNVRKNLKKISEKKLIYISIYIKYLFI